jgi:ATP-dependent Lon protease
MPSSRYNFRDKDKDKKDRINKRKRNIIQSDSEDEFYEELDKDYDPKKIEDSESTEALDAEEEEHGKKKLRRKKHEEESEDAEDVESESEGEDVRKKLRRKNPQDEDDFIVPEEGEGGPIIIDIGKLLSELAGGQLEEGEEEGEEEGMGIPSFKNAKEKYLSTLTCEEKRTLLEKEEKILKPITNDDIPLRYKILNMDLDEKIMSFVLSKVVQFEKMNPMFGASEYYKLKKYLDGFVNVPFGKYKQLGVYKHDSSEKIKDFLCRLEFNLTANIYGQQKAKNSILQVMGSWISNPEKTGNVIGLHGYPGVGKTSIGKAFAKSLNIPVVFIPLGGMSTSLTLCGSDYVYEGSSWGKIVSSLISTKCMNPIFFFDELDKISDTKEGNDLSNLLIHLTDPTQNSEFTDKYFTGITFDLSRCFFIFSFNDKNLIHPILKDRINLIKMDNFTDKDKVNIAIDYSLPKIIENVGLDSSLFNIPRDTLAYIAITYCRLEKGVRKMEQCIKTIIMKINLLYLTGDYSTLQLDVKTRLQIDFPIVVNKEIASKLLDPVYNEEISHGVEMMYI